MATRENRKKFYLTQAITQVICNILNTVILKVSSIPQFLQSLKYCKERTFISVSCFIKKKAMEYYLKISS